MKQIAKFPARREISREFLRASEAPNANLWSDEFRMPFDQIPQADFRRDAKIVGTKVESLRTPNTNKSAVVMTYSKRHSSEFAMNFPPSGPAPERYKVAQFAVVGGGKN